MDVGDLSFLPPEIVTMLKRKASRDPSSRFAAKLHTLLSYSATHPGLEDRIGCAWVTDTEFRINKQTLGRVMGIKVNSLNVDLHAHDFHQKKYHKEGWTLWTHNSFTRNSLDVISSDPAIHSMRRSVPMTFALGMSSPETCEIFTNLVRHTWHEIVPDIPPDAPCPAERLVEACARHFKLSEQPLKNAEDVMKAILLPSDQAMLTFAQFGKIMAMFGPQKTMMQKIRSLLTCSNSSGQWLAFERSDPSSSPSGIAGTFDDHEPNCLVIRQMKGPPIRVWNMPLVDTSEPYVVDEHGERYESWDEYFRRNPLVRDDFGLPYV